MTTNDATRLRTVLYLDAAICTVFGLFCAGLAGPLSGFTGLPGDLLFYAGLALLPVAVFMAFAARQATPSRLLVWMILLGNEAWILGSIAILIFGIVEPNTLGCAFVVAQAVAVLPLVLLEYQGLRRLPVPAAA